MRKNHILIFGVASLAIVFFVFVISNQAMYESGKSITVQGEVSCMTRGVGDADTTRLDICLMGLREADSNRFWVLKGHPALSQGEKVKVSGTIRPYAEKYGNYDVEGTIDVTSVTRTGPVQTQSGGSEITKEKQASLQRRPPPTPLESWGKETGTIREAKSKTGFSEARLPSSVPGNLELKSIRTKISSGDEDGVRLLTAVYAPKDMMKLDNNTAMASVLSDGGFFIVYSYEPIGVGKEEWMRGFAANDPYSRKLDTLDQTTNMLKIKGKPEHDTNSEIFFYMGDIKVNLVSKVHDVSELEQIAKTIVE